MSPYAYDDKGVYISTWGKVGTLIPWSVFQKKVTSEAGIEECYVVLAPDWYSNGNLAPNGIAVADLQAALTAIGGGTVPPVPTPGPTPVPPGPTPVPPDQPRRPRTHSRKSSTPCLLNWKRFRQIGRYCCGR